MGRMIVVMMCMLLLLDWFARVQLDAALDEILQDHTATQEEWSEFDPKLKMLY